MPRNFVAEVHFLDHFYMVFKGCLPKLFIKSTSSDQICKELNSFQNLWFAYDVIKNMIMQIEINVPQILIWLIIPVHKIYICTEFEVI